MSKSTHSKEKRSATSRHPTQDVEDADAVYGDEGGEVGGDVDLLQGASCRIEGLQCLASLHVPPLTNRQRNKHQKKRGSLTSPLLSLMEAHKQCRGRQLDNWLWKTVRFSANATTSNNLWLSESFHSHFIALFFNANSQSYTPPGSLKHTQLLLNDSV